MSRRAAFQNLLSDRPLIAPSMLRCDFGNLHREVELLEAAGVRLLHLDVMDGHFVPNLSYGAMVIERLRELTALPFDAHLMITDPCKYLDSFLEAGCDAITVHIEAARDPIELLRRIRAAGCAAGIALSPQTPVERILPVLGDCDIVLVMSVEPGFGGQQFIPGALDKLRQLRPLLPAGTRLSVDGGITTETISSAAQAGADLFVAGSSIFKSADYGEAVARLAAAAGGQAAPLH